MTILSSSDENIERAAELIRNGGIVAFPTETVYGLGADALNPIAVTKIFEAKKRPFFDPLILHISDVNMLNEITPVISDDIIKLTDKFWPGPLTIVMKKLKSIPDIVTSGLDTVAVRMPDHPVALKLIDRVGSPVSAPSANPFGYINPTEAIHVEKQLGKEVNIILDGGRCRVGVESTIIKYDEDGFFLLRHGGVPEEEIEKITGSLKEYLPNENPESPGQLPFHYSPDTKIKLVDKIRDIDFTLENTGYLLFKSIDKEYPKERTFFLSEEGNLNEAAANLFYFFHKLDNLNFKLIIAEAVPETGLGKAIMDRLNRAAKKRG